MTRLALTLLALLLVSCSSYFVRKECDQLNWYQVGFDAALRGERISNDPQVNRCRKAEAEISESQLDLGFKAGMSRYCQPDGAYQTGKNGETFNLDFCETGSHPVLRKKHQEGLAAYCGDGMNAGLSGKKYKNVCPSELEKSFLPEYRKGRKKYLSGMIQNSESKVRELDVELDRLHYSKRINDNRLTLLPVAKSGEQDPFSAERSRLSNESWRLNSSISSTEQEKRKHQNQIDTFKAEIVTLD